LFLDEVGELPLELQSKLLRVLETRTIRRIGSGAERKLEVRFIAATNRDLRADVNSGRFRSDLFFRLAVVQLVIPPLRSRAEDIPAVAAKLLESLGLDASQVPGILTPALIEHLSGAPWPGNVRELRNFLERYLIFAEETLTSEQSPPLSGHPAPAGYAEARERALAEFERQFVQQSLLENDGNVSRACRSAGISRELFYRLMRRHRIDGVRRAR
jgi:DNA-binding NtrC family response regulator